jgi:hypothetical protein
VTTAGRARSSATGPSCAVSSTVSAGPRWTRPATRSSRRSTAPPGRSVPRWR